MLKETAKSGIILSVVCILSAGCVATTPPSGETPQLTQAQIDAQEDARYENARRAKVIHDNQVAAQRAQQQAFIRQTQAKHATPPPPPRRPAPINIPSPKRF